MIWIVSLVVLASLAASFALAIIAIRYQWPFPPMFLTREDIERAAAEREERRQMAKRIALIARDPEA